MQGCSYPQPVPLSDEQLEVLEAVERVWPSQSLSCEHKPLIDYVRDAEINDRCISKVKVAGCFYHNANVIILPERNDDALLHELLHWRHYCDQGIIDYAHQLNWIWRGPRSMFRRAQRILKGESDGLHR